jgi:hypothetical protein
MSIQPLQSISTSDLQAFLSAPEQLLQQSVALQLAVASYPDTPRSLLAILVNNPNFQVAEAAQMHVNFAGELRENWQQAIDEKLRNAQIGQNDRLAVELLKIAPVPPCFLSEWVPAEKLIEGLQNPYLRLRDRLQIVERLAREETLEPRLQVAESPETPLPVLELLAGDLELPVRLAVKFNPSCPPALIALVEGQHAVAKDWNTDAQQLTNLANSRWGWIRITVAQNPSSPAETLMRLAKDEISKIQLAVAKNPNAPAEVLAVLAHLEKTIQAAVAVHPNATEEILHQLFSTQQALLKSRNDLPTSILERFFNESSSSTPLWKNYQLRHLLLSQTNTPTWILAEFANIDIEKLTAEKLEQEQNGGSTPGIHKEWVSDEIRFLVEVAKHPQVSEEILERIAQYPNFKSKLTVAQNLKTRESFRLQLLESLSDCPDRDIRVEVAKNLNTPVFILKKMAQSEFYQPKLRQEIRRVLASEYPENSRRYGTTADMMMSNLKHKVLDPANIFIDIDSWINIIENSETWELMLDNVTPTGMLWSLIPSVRRLINRLIPRWSELLPELSEDSLQKVVISIHNILGIIKDFVKEHQFMRCVAVALVGNPNTPIDLREQLKNRLIRPSIALDASDNDCDVYLALAYNLAVPEAERMKYLQQLLNYSGKRIAGDPRTPIELLEKLLEQGHKYQENLAKNPATPEYLLRRIADERQEYLWRTLAENPNTPTDLLIRFLQEKVENKVYSNITMFELIIKNPNLLVLDRYRLLLAKEDAEETAKANELMAHRTDSPYALAQVLEKGDVNAKLTAARSYKTPIHILEQLAKEPDEKVRQAVAQNPNLPFNKLLELARDPSEKVRSQLIYKPSHQKTPTPVQLLEILAQDVSEWIRTKVAEHPDTPIEILVALANTSSRQVKAAVVKNLKTPVAILERLGLQEEIFDIRNPNTPGNVLAQAVNRILGSFHQNDPRWSGLESTNKPLVALLKHPVKGSQMPASTLERLASHHYPSVRMEVAAHPNTPTSTLEKLVNDSYVPTLRVLANNPNTPPHILEQLANTPDLTTRLSVARHPHTLPRTLAQMVLSTQTSGNVPNRTKDTLKSAFPGNHNDLLRSLANNPRTPLEALEILARREFVSAMPDPQSFIPPTTDDEIMRSLAYNPSLTSELLGILSQDPCVDVRIVLIRHPNLTEALWLRLAQDEAISVREAVASNINAPASVLEILSHDEQSEVRVKVAANSKTAIAILEFLADDENSTVRTAIASNPNLPAIILERLANDKKVEVRCAVAQNPNTPASIRELLQDLVLQPITRQTSPTLRGLPRLYKPQTDDLATLLTEYARSQNAFVRFVTLLHPLAPGEVLMQGAQSASWLERYAVADNPATTAEIRQQLALDSNRIVRAVAIENLSA